MMLALALAAMLAAVAASSSGGGGSSRGPPFPVNDADLVTSFSSALGKRLIIAQATRAWRGPEVRAFIGINGSSEEALQLSQRHSGHNETYSFFPDEGTGFLGSRWHGQFAGDSRAVMAPILAYKHYGETFKWMLYGDDDTVWFTHAAKQLLKNYDPELPHAISDRSWHIMCLPCHYDPTNPPKGDTNGEGVPVAPPQPAEKLAGNTTLPYPRACPYCSTSVACGRRVPTNTTGKVKGGCGPGTIYGGSGMIISVGLLRRLSYDLFLKCVLEQFEVKGSDRMIGVCLFDSGFSMTDPGSVLAHGGDQAYRLFMPGWPHDRFMNNDVALEPLIHNKCNEMCLWRAWNQVSMHAKVRNFKSPAQAAAQIIGIGRAHRAALEYLELLRSEGRSFKEGPAALGSWRRRGARRRRLMSLEHDVASLFGTAGSSSRRRRPKV